MKEGAKKDTREKEDSFASKRKILKVNEMRADIERNYPDKLEEFENMLKQESNHFRRMSAYEKLVENELNK